MTTSKREQARAQQIEEKKKKWRVDLPQVRADHVIPMWLAHNRGIKGAPKEAQTNRNWSGFFYSGTKLFRGGGTGVLVAEQRTSKGKPHYIALVRPMADSDALRSISSSVVGNGPVVYVQNNMLKPETAVRALRTFSSYMYRVNSDPKIRVERQRAVDKEVRRAILYNRPIAVKHRAEYERLQIIQREASSKAYHLTYNLRPTGDEILALLGHTHVEGMMYKRLSKVRAPYSPPPIQQYQSRAASFVWPPIGDWAPTVNDVHICTRGYHLCPKNAIPEWAIHGNELFLAEGLDVGGSQHDKTVYARARLVKYIGDISTITNEKLAAHRKLDIAAVQKAVVDTKAAVEAYYKKYQKYL